MDRREHVILDDTLRDQDRVFKVVAIPRHECDEHVPAKRKFAEVGRRTVCNNVALRNSIAHFDDRTLVDAAILIRPAELGETIDVHTRLRAFKVFRCADHDTERVNLLYHTCPAGDDGGAAVTRNNRLHAGANERGLGMNQWNGLTLHVRTHEGAVCVIVFEERNERGSNRHNLLRGDVHVLDVIFRNHGCFAGNTRVDEFVLEFALFVHRCVGLSN